MKKTFPIVSVIMILVFIVTGIFLCFSVANASYTEKYDATQMRRIIHTAEENFPELTDRAFSEYDIPFAILDKKGDVIYKSDPAAVSTPDEALAYSAPSSAFSQGMIIFSPSLATENAGQKAYQKKLGLIILAVYIFSGICIAGLCFYVHRNVIKPFRKLDRFAKEIAAGNLDFPLEMDKAHVFGEFTESFDLMRSELAAARQREFLASQEKKEMIASLSHDIRTPVTSIRVVSEFLTATESSSDKIERLETIREKTDQIEQLVSNLFHSALEELDAFSVNADAHYSNELVKIFKDADFYSQLSEISEIPECLIYYDELRLSQIAGNLMYNAYKYGEAPVKLELSIKDEVLEAAVIDSGKGVSEDDLPFIFNKYYRGKNSEGKNGGGLGLAICRSLMEKMNGEIDAVNRKDGFSVILKFPLA